MKIVNIDQVWDQFTDEARRAILDDFIDTADIPSDTKWEALPYGIRHAIYWHN